MDELLHSGLASPAAEAKLAAMLIQHGDLAAAEKLLVSSLATDPNQAQAQGNFGRNLPGAKEICSRRLGLLPESGAADARFS